MTEILSPQKTYEPVIGLEVHVQLKTQSKLFCSCRTEFGAEPNSQICPVCTGQPGVLPVLNKAAVEAAVKVGLAFGCTVNRDAFFARKQYFYPDLPKAYQISQSSRPLCENGRIDVSVAGKKKTIRIQRIHMEEDAGKLLHSIGSSELSYSLVDLNRSGMPLIEIVSHPDLSSPEEAYEYLSFLKSTVQFIGVSDCDMEKGSLRCDANISIRPAGSQTLGTKVEVKNMNSFRAVKSAIAHEVDRQVEVIESGGRLFQETRLWNESKMMTASMRSKEEAHDYRYFPEPDLVPLQLSRDWVESLRKGLPELPEQRRDRLVEELGLSDYDSNLLVSERALVDFYEGGLKDFSPDKKRAFAKPLANWITTELLGRLNADKKSISESPVSAVSLAELVGLIQDGAISGKMGKEVFAEAYETGSSPKSIVEKKGLKQVSDEGEILKIVKDVIAENPKIVADIKGGKDRAVGSLVGAVMKKSKGRANPQKANELIKKELT